MATITEDCVSFETAKLLKEKGFDEPCRAVCKPLYKVGIPNKEDVLNTYEQSCEAAIKYYLKSKNYYRL